MTDVEIAELDSLKGLELLSPDERDRFLAETADRLQDKLAARGKKIRDSLKDG